MGHGGQSLSSGSMQMSGPSEMISDMDALRPKMLMCQQGRGRKPVNCGSTRTEVRGSRISDLLVPGMIESRRGRRPTKAPAANWATAGRGFSRTGTTWSAPRAALFRISCPTSSATRGQVGRRRRYTRPFDEVWHGPMGDVCSILEIANAVTEPIEVESGAGDA